MSLDADQRIAYLQHVYEAFYAQRGTGEWPPVSSAEYDLVRRWLDAGIPLRVVLTAIREAKRPARNLLYFEPIVAAEARRVQRALGGM